MMGAAAASLLRGGRLALLLVLLALTGAARADTPRETLAWAGPYQGLLPCADCEGIVTLLELTAEGHYRLSERYAGRSETPFVTSGTFTWDDTGSVITLDGFDWPRRYMPGQGLLRALDLEGRVIKGDLAAAYVLTKAE